MDWLSYALGCLTTPLLSLVVLLVLLWATREWRVPASASEPRCVDPGENEYLEVRR